MHRVAAVQMNSGAGVRENLETAGRLLEDAAGQGCQLAVLPENFALMPARGRDKSRHAEAEGDGPIQEFLSETAERLGIWIVGGSIPLASDDAKRVYGATIVVGDDGEQKAVYRKIHLFDVDLPDREESYRESHSMVPGGELALIETPVGVLGLTICYDVRFPELFRELVDRGASLFSVPAAFTVVTGTAHWHTLLRARAIENLAWIIAPGQYGSHPDGRSTYGHSLICDPWGRVVVEQAAGEGVVTADIDLPAQTRLRQEFPALANRRLHTIELE